jgi:hypothetical protein
MGNHEVVAAMASLHLRLQSEHDRLRRLVLLEIDQQLAEGPRLGVAQNVPTGSLPQFLPRCSTRSVCAAVELRNGMTEPL